LPNLKVWLPTYHPVNLDETIRLIRLAGGQCWYVFDIAMKMPLQAMIEAIRDDYGRTISW
jgi:hypothetical protein